MKFPKGPLSVSIVITYVIALCFSIAYRFGEIGHFVTVEEIRFFAVEVPTLVVIVISSLFFLSRPFIMIRETTNGITKWRAKKERGVAMRIFTAFGALAIICVSLVTGYLFFFVPFNGI